MLENENIFIMNETRAERQDIRPLKILLLNLMPKKIETEIQILRLLSNTPLQVDVEFMKTASYQPKNTSPEHLLKFYKTFDEIKGQKFDGMIITGAPVENLEFDKVAYWDELCTVMEWSKKNVYSTLHICWGAQAGLFYHHGIKKTPLAEKMFGIFPHRILNKNHCLTRGFDDVFFAPHSRHTTVSQQDIANCDTIELLSVSDTAGIYIAADKAGRQIFVTGHAEYDADTLDAEYRRDLGAGLQTKPPVNYYPCGDETKPPVFNWRSHANLLFSNWLNYFVYQSTPYDLDEL